MKIVYDGHIFRWQKFGGISRVFGEVISRLPPEWTPAILGLETRPDNLPRHPRLEVSLLSSIRPRRYSQPLKNRWWQRQYFEKANLFHPTYYKLSARLRLADIKCPLVVSVHDFIHAAYPRQIEDADWTIRAQRLMIERADQIICISESTQRDLLRRHPETAGKTCVIHLASSFPVAAQSNAATLFPDPTFLYVGGRDGYKNFLFLLQAFANACEKHPRIRLQIAGAPLNAAERWQAHFLGIDDRIDVAVSPDEPTLQKLYHGCTALLYPSRYEGFGIPPLEAMASGTVAVTSNTTSLPEVMGAGGIMLDPTREDDWTDCLLQLANGTFNREELTAKGRAQAALFSWEKTAAQHIDIYKKFA